MAEENLILDALRQPVSAAFYEAIVELRRRWPDRVVIGVEDVPFHPGGFADENGLKLEVVEDVPQELLFGSRWERTNALTYLNSWVRVWWESHEFDILAVSIYVGGPIHRLRHLVVGPSREAALAFIEAIVEWSSALRDEVLVFRNGCWSKSAALYQSVMAASLSDLVMPDRIKDELVRDFESFFASREVYADHGIPWKRGALFVGPPGNGKTLAAKALIQHLEVPCLYVRSFEAQYGSSSAENVSLVFDRARKSAPCILVLEDLDSLVTEATRAYFLNELDGFAANEGVLTLATTNHPERLDPAILDRPSRFDRKYPFPLPEQPERERYLRLFASKLQPALQPSDDTYARLADETDGFSYAYLKELFLSAMMRWIGDRRQRIDDVLRAQVPELRAQMAFEPDKRLDVDGAEESAHDPLRW